MSLTTNTKILKSLQSWSSRGPRPLPVQRFTRTHRTLPIVLLMAMICYSKRIQISKEKKGPPWDKVQRQSGANIQGLWESHRLWFLSQPWVVTAPVKYCLPGKLISDSASRMSFGLVTQKPAVGHVPKPHTPGMQAGIQQKLSCWHSLGTVSHADEGMVGSLPKSKFPDTSQGPRMQAGLSRRAIPGLLC